MWHFIMKNKKDDKELKRTAGDAYDTIHDIKYIAKQKILHGYYLSEFVAEKNR